MRPASAARREQAHDDDDDDDDGIGSKANFARRGSSAQSSRRGPIIMRSLHSRAAPGSARGSMRQDVVGHRGPESSMFDLTMGLGDDAASSHEWNDAMLTEYDSAPVDPLEALGRDKLDRIKRGLWLILRGQKITTIEGVAEFFDMVKEEMERKRLRDESTRHGGTAGMVENLVMNSFMARPAETGSPTLNAGAAEAPEMFGAFTASHAGNTTSFMGSPVETRRNGRLVGERCVERCVEHARAAQPAGARGCKRRCHGVGAALSSTSSSGAGCGSEWQ